MANLGEIRHDKEHAYGFSLDLLVRVKGLLISAPDGQQFQICTDRNLGYEPRHGFNHFLDWAFEHTGMEEQISEILGMEPHLRRDQQPRDDVDVGTCGICVKQFKTKPDQRDALVNHGFQRPGDGYLIGKCFGVGYPAYELSNQACREYIPVLQAVRQEKARTLVKLEMFKGTELVPSKKEGEPYVTLTPADPQFKTARTARIRSLKGEIAELTDFLEVLNERVVNWELAPDRIRRAGQPPRPLRELMVPPKGLQRKR